MLWRLRTKGEGALSGQARKGFETFGRQWQPLLFGILRKYCGGSSHEVEDIVHDVLLRALLQWDELQHWEAPKQRAWLGRVAKNCFLDRCRRRSSELDRLSALLALSADVDAPDEAEQNELWGYIEMEDLRWALGFLPPTLRQAFELHQQGWSYASIAQVAGVKQGTVGARLHDARAALHERLKETAEKRRRERRQ
ncbi:RNA polymerase sigma factor [Myxococcus sp. K38C18041901]|uniref:RNA polymerase sigma factor n=1 Tax=Myxococcus guangdongensis TaxID=2906760 RepID=UPI0020A72F18|nr:RNA polymerase sigma factor [Myxococcus guangdongensis]MCP3057447.1 RNA polymerase sigma factor [Myxococcus guangdongensis]